MHFINFRRLICTAAIALLTSLAPAAHPAFAQDNWAADDDAFEARKIERYQQLVDQSPEKSYAFTQLMATVGKGAQYQQLLKTYEKKVEAKPQNFNLRMILGHMYQHGGRTNEAIAAYKAALGIKQTPLAFMSIAAAEADNKNFVPAVENYEAALKLNPNKEQKQEVYRALAELSLERRDMDRAKTYFAELIKLEPNSLFVRRELAQIYTQNRMFAQAREVLEQASKQASVSSAEKDQIDFDIAELYESEGLDDQALPRYEALSNRLPASNWMQRELTARIIDINRRSGDIAGLANTLEKKWKSPNYQQHLELADLYDETGDADKALAHLQKAASMSPKLPEAHDKLVRFYRSHGQISKMFEAKTAQIKAIPDNPEYRFELYELYQQQKQIDKAIATLDELQKKFPSNFDVQRRVAEFYQMNGRTQKALDIYESWAKKNPNDLEALEALGDQYDAKGDKSKALVTWKRIEDLNIDKATKLETLARIYDEHGYASEAESLYAKALAANKSDCEAQQQYADVLTRNGKHMQAIEAWQNLAMTCKAAPARQIASRQLASLYNLRGTQQTAINQYRGQCESNPNSLDHHLMFANLATALMRPDDAIPTLESFVNRNQSTDALKALHELYTSAGKLDDARNTLERLSALSETDRRDALIAMSELDLKIGDLEAAQNHLSEALALNANDADAHEKLGDILIKRRLYEEAANNYETAFQIDSRNFHIAFKTATTLAILGKTKEADDIYVQIITNSPDEDLSQKSARRAIDDHASAGTLDELAKSLLPLLRSKNRKALYLDILLTLADAQAQSHTMTLLTRDASRAYPARHALRELSDKYASLLSEAMLFNDVSISSRAVTLSEWLASANTIPLLAQMIEKAPVSDTGRTMQIQAIEAIAHTQLPAAVPFLKSFTDSKYSNELRELAVWALGLIPSKSANDVLVDMLKTNFTSMRALAVIGLGRQNAKLDLVYDMLKSDPSDVVLDAAAWVLAYRKEAKAFNDIKSLYNRLEPTPHRLWALSRIEQNGAGQDILNALWLNSNQLASAKYPAETAKLKFSQNRAMAANIIRSEFADADIATLSLAEAQKRVLNKRTSHYQPYFSTELMLESFSAQSLNDTQNTTKWLKAHQSDFVNVVQTIANMQSNHPDQQYNARIQMLRDLTTPASLPQFDVNQSDQQPVITEAAQKITQQLKNWLKSTNTQNERSLAGLSLQALALTKSQDALTEAKTLAQSDSNMPLRLNAIQAIASFNTDQSRQLIRTLASDSNYLIRATAVSYLDPKNKDDQAVLNNAVNDEYLIVSETAKKLIIDN